MSAALLALFALAGCGGGGAEQSVTPSGWSAVGTQGGPVFSIQVDPKSSETVYTSSYDGVFKSTDGGAHWSLRGSDLGEGVVLALDPSRPQTVYAGDQGAGLTRAERRVPIGLCVSEDGGKTWSRATGLPEGVAVVALAAHPSRPGVVFAGTVNRGWFENDPGIFKSADGGKTWHAFNDGLPASHGDYPSVDTLVVSPDRGGTVYAATSEGLFRSPAGRAGWAKAGLGDDVRSLAVDPTPPRTVYAATDKGLFRAAGSDGWASMPLREAVSVVVTDPKGSGVLYAATSHGVMRSADAGTTWNQTGLRTQITVLAIDPRHRGTLYAGTLDRAVLKSTDRGAHWLPAGHGITATVPQVVSTDPRSPETVYVASLFGGIVKSSDHGATWQTADTGLPALSAAFKRPTVAALALDPTDPKRLYAAARYGLFTSSTAGASWKALPEASGHGPTSVGALVLDARSPRTLYALDSGDVYASGDDGASFQKLDFGSSEDALALALDPSDAKTLYVGTEEGGIYKSIDHGGKWWAVTAGLPCDESYPFTCAAVQALAVDPGAPATLYAGTDRGVLKSTDGGAHWATAGKGLPLSGQADVVSFLVDPASSSTLYAGTTAGVFRSTDAAGNWTALGRGREHQTIVALDLEKAGSKLYAATAGGTYVRTVPAGSKAPGSTAPAPSPTSTESRSGVTSPLAGWTVLGPSSVGVQNLVFDPRHPLTVYLVASSLFDTELYRSRDGGKSWTPLNPISGGAVHDVAVDRSGGLHVAMEMGDAEQMPGSEAFTGSVFNSRDDGKSWTRSDAYFGFQNQISTESMRVLLADRARPGVLYVVASSIVWRSDDSGRTWVRSNKGIPGEDTFEIVAGGRAGTLYASTNAHGLYKTTDGARTWHRVRLDGVAAAFSLDNPADSTDGPRIATASTGDTIYAFQKLGNFQSGISVLARSTDGGRSWKRLPLTALRDSNLTTLVVDPTNPRTLYATTEILVPDTWLVFESTTGGATWTKLAEAHGVTPHEERAQLELVAVDPTGKRIYLGTFRNGIYVCTSCRAGR